MIKKQSYLLTATLLNSWLYLYKCGDEYFEKSYQDFLSTLNREKHEPTEAMQKGIEFERSVYQGEDEKFSPIVSGGAYQVKGEKVLDKFLFYGILDFIKNGVIYDVKRVSRWSSDTPKYMWSSQHIIYLYIWESVDKFVYLIRDEEGNSHTETYHREDIDIEGALRYLIKNFMEFLKENKLLEIYKSKWATRE